MESCELNLNYKDHCLIIVGDGGPSDELLARRRLLAGGRLAHFLVSEGQVKIRGEEPNVIFAWQPFNSSEAGMASPLGRKLGQSFKTYWTKTGADCIVVPPNHTLHIYTLNGQMRHVRLVHEQGHVLMEISGEVVLEPDDEVAGTWEVGVEDPELKAFGTFSKRYVLKSLVVVLVWHVMRWTVSIKFDGSAEDGQDPWWRGLLVVLSAVFLCAPGVWKNWAASLSGESDVDLMDKMYAWVGSVVLTLLLNVVARSGWTRLCLFLALKKAAGLKRALFFAPTAFGKLHDEIKIYAGYFRFPAIFALVLSRALVYQNLSLSGPGSPVYNASAGAALLCLLVAEYLEDFIVIQQIVPMSPVLPELIDYDLQKSSRHTSYLSAEVRRMCPDDSQTGWRLDELNDSGFKKSGARTLQMTSPCGDRSKLSSILPLPESSGGGQVPGTSVQPPRLVCIRGPEDKPQAKPCANAQDAPNAPAQQSVLLVNVAGDSRRANLPRQSALHVISNSSQPKSDTSNMSEQPAGSLDVPVEKSQRQSMLDANLRMGRQASNSSTLQRNSSRKSMLDVNVVIGRRTSNDLNAQRATLPVQVWQDMNSPVGSLISSASNVRRSSLDLNLPIGRRTSNDSNAERANSPRQSILDVNVPLGRQMSGDSCVLRGNSPRESGRQISNNSSLQKSDASSLSEDAKALAPAVSRDVSTAPLGRQISTGSNRQRDSPRPSMIEVNVGMQRQISNGSNAARATSPRRSRLEPNVADERQFSNGSLALQKSDSNLSEDAKMPQLVASLGQRGGSKPSAIRRWFGQERAVQPSLLLHGLRELPWDCQLSAVAIVCEDLSVTWMLLTARALMFWVLRDECSVSLWHFVSALAAEAPEDEAEKDGAEEAIAPLTWDLGKSMLAGQWANARLYSMLNKHGSARCAATEPPQEDAPLEEVMDEPDEAPGLSQIHCEVEEDHVEPWLDRGRTAHCNLCWIYPKIKSQAARVVGQKAMSSSRTQASRSTRWKAHKIQPSRPSPPSQNCPSLTPSRSLRIHRSHLPMASVGRGLSCPTLCSTRWSSLECARLLHWLHRPLPRPLWPRRQKRRNRLQQTPPERRRWRPPQVGAIGVSGPGTIHPWTMDFIDRQEIYPFDPPKADEFRPWNSTPHCACGTAAPRSHGHSAERHIVRRIVRRIVRFTVVVAVERDSSMAPRKVDYAVLASSVRALIYKDASGLAELARQRGLEEKDLDRLRICSDALRHEADH
ncbi:unnamed protein product [Durusdinium trenchii]|uniref:Pecanex-like protein n=1 Tax=Durusdinium trenchii TaxID=1381693 RepID=A0ABP0PUV7_9DINO